MCPALSAPDPHSYRSTQEVEHTPGTHLLPTTIRPRGHRVWGVEATRKASLRGHQSQDGGEGRISWRGLSQALGKRFVPRPEWRSVWLEEQAVGGGGRGQCVRRLNFLATPKGMSCTL